MKSLLLLCFCLSIVPVTAQPVSILKAGAAKRDVTPKEPVPMWGYGARRATLSVGALDPLIANIVVIQAGNTKVAIIGTDLGRSPSEQSLQRIRERIKKSAGVEWSFISGSHAHHGPVLELNDEPRKGKGKFDAAIRYYKEMEDAIVSGVEEANSKLVDARLAVGSVALPNFNRNRHTKITPKPSDSDLGLLRFEDLNGKPIALVVNFTAHPTMISAGVLKFSADFVGAMKNLVEKETGGVAVFMQGAAGDQSANEGPNKGYQAFGEALGREVLKLNAELKAEVSTNASWKVREERFRFEARTDLKNPGIRMMYDLAFFPELVENFVAEYEDGVRPRLTVALLNDEIALVGASGEFFSNHSIRLKERARVKKLFFYGYCNGYHQYFPTIEAVAEGGYGADDKVSPVEVGAGEHLMNQALTWIYTMQGKIK